MTDPQPGPGHNVPPTDTSPLLARLQEDHKALIERRDELLAGIKRSPPNITDEATAKIAADFVQGQINGFLKSADAIHNNEKAPFLLAGRTVDSFLHTLIDDVAEGKRELNARRKRYADAKADEERRQREARARKARQEQIKAEREARAKQEQAEAIKKKEYDRQARVAKENAERAANVAISQKKHAEAKPADLGRTRGDYGAVTSLKAFWAFTAVDRKKLQFGRLSQYFTDDAIHDAIQAYIDANSTDKRCRKMPGVRFYRETKL